MPGRSFCKGAQCPFFKYTKQTAKIQALAKYALLLITVQYTEYRYSLIIIFYKMLVPYGSRPAL
jgi:hypothetical protein